MPTSVADDSTDDVDGIVGGSLFIYLNCQRAILVWQQQLQKIARKGQWTAEESVYLPIQNLVIYESSWQQNSTTIAINHTIHPATQFIIGTRNVSTIIVGRSVRLGLGFIICFRPSFELKCGQQLFERAEPICSLQISRVRGRRIGKGIAIGTSECVLDS